MSNNRPPRIPNKEAKPVLAQRTITATVHNGPLPDPNTLKGYEEILHGAADRIISMAESEQVHQQKCETKVIGDEFILNLIGLIFAFIIATGWLFAATYLLAHKMFVSGGLMGATAVALIISQFARPRPHHRQSKDQK